MSVKFNLQNQWQPNPLGHSLPTPNLECDTQISIIFVFKVFRNYFKII